MVSLGAPRVLRVSSEGVVTGQQKDQTAACGHAEEDGVPGVAGSDSLGPGFGGPGTHPVQIRGSVERALGVLSWNLFSTML